MAIRLGPNQYGKAEVRVVAVDRSSPRHTLRRPERQLEPARRLRRRAHRRRQQPRAGHGHPEEHRVRLRPRRRRLARRRSACGWPGTSPAPTTGSPARGSASSPTAGTGSPSAGSRTTTRSRATASEVRTAVVDRGRRRGARARRADRPRRCSRPPARSSGASPATGTRPSPRPGTGSSPPRSPPAGATPATDLDFDASFAGVRTRPAGGVRRARTRSPCSSRCTRWARPCWSESPRSPRSGCRCRTSTTSCRTCPRSGWTTPDVVYHADDRPYGLIEGTVAAGRRRRPPRPPGRARPASAEPSAGLDRRCRRTPTMAWIRRSAPCSSWVRCDRAVGADAADPAEPPPDPPVRRHPHGHAAHEQRAR